MKNISSKNSFGQYYLLEKYLDGKLILVSADSICCEKYCIPIYEKYVRNSS